MLIAYVDETGDTGPTTKNGASACYGLGCVVVNEKDWLHAFDEALTLRRNLKAKYHIPVRKEVKSSYIVRGNGTLKGLELPPHERKTIFRAHLKTITKFQGRAFAVVVDKKATGLSGPECLHTAWETLLQRLERTCAADHQQVLVIHDHGEDLAVRREIRKARRFLTAGGIGGHGSFRFHMPVIEDAVPRDSAASYLIQLADLVAYTGWRTYMRPSRTIAQIVPHTTWSQLGDSVHTAVNRNKLNGSVPGVVLRA